METDFESGFAKERYGVTHAELEAMGERAVRNDLNSGKYGSADNKIHLYVSSWLKDKEFARLEAREEESLSIARKALSISTDANEISRSAKKWAIAAIIVSTVSAVAIAIIQTVFGPTQ